jgi:hypothetical protein
MIAFACGCGAVLCYYVYRVWKVRWIGLMGWPCIAGSLVFAALGK